MEVSGFNSRIKCLYKSNDLTVDLLFQSQNDDDVVVVGAVDVIMF